MYIRLIVTLHTDHPVPPAIKIRTALEEYGHVTVSIDETNAEVADIMKRTREMFAPIDTR